MRIIECDRCGSRDDVSPIGLGRLDIMYMEGAEALQNKDLCKSCLDGVIDFLKPLAKREDSK